MLPRVADLIIREAPVKLNLRFEELASVISGQSPADSGPPRSMAQLILAHKKVSCGSSQLLCADRRSHVYKPCLSQRAPPPPLLSRHPPRNLLLDPRGLGGLVSLVQGACPHVTWRCAGVWCSRRHHSSARRDIRPEAGATCFIYPKVPLRPFDHEMPKSGAHSMSSLYDKLP